MTNYLNLFADFLLSKLPTECSTILQIIDCENFLIIKGETTSTEILNLLELKDDFILKYPELIKKEVLPTIDLIVYDSKLPKLKELEITYNNNSINNNLFTNSQYPHGISMDQGRLLYYYGLHIFKNIPSNYVHGEITMKLTSDKNKLEEVFNIKNNNIDDEVLRSAILDVFDFNMGWIENEIKKVDFLDPLHNLSFLERKVDDFIII